MEISSLGEFGLIKRLTGELQVAQPSTLKGVGDDAAVLQYEEGERTVVTTDMLMEGVHFDLTYMSMQHLGYKAAMVNISDLCAMNATPKQLLISMAVSKKFKVEDLEDFYAGVRAACTRYNIDIVGGDTTSSYTGLAISITAIGSAKEGDIVYRNGAKENELICVSGDLGAAYCGLQLLEREKVVYYQQLEENPKAEYQPEFAGKEYLLQRQLQPEARVDIVEKLRAAGLKPTSMIDISDGLSSELHHICEQSGVGCRIFENKIPIDYQTALMAEELNMNLTTCALNGGEDYELLFTVPLTQHDAAAAIEGVKVIGHTCDKSLGLMLVTRDGGELELKAQGWEALREKE